MSREDVRRQLEDLFADYGPQPDPGSEAALPAESAPETEREESAAAPLEPAQASSGAPKQPEKRLGTPPQEPTEEAASTEPADIVPQDTSDLSIGKELSERPGESPERVAEMDLEGETPENPAVAGAHGTAVGPSEDEAVLQRETESDEDLWRSGLLDLVLSGATLGGSAVFLALLLSSVRQPARMAELLPGLSGVILLGGAFAIRGLSLKWKVATVIGVAYGAVLFSVWQYGAVNVASWYLLTIPLLFFLLVGERAGLVAAGVHMVLYVSLAAGQQAGWLGSPAELGFASQPIRFWLASATFALVIGLIAAVQRSLVQDRVALAAQLRERNQELETAQEARKEQGRRLEVAEAAYQGQARSLRMSQQLARLSTEGMALARFSERVVQLLCDGLGAGSVALFLLDEGRVATVLRAHSERGGDGEAQGQARIAVSEDALLQACMAHRQVRVVGEGDPLLGDQALPQSVPSMVALPLVVQEEAVGGIVVYGSELAPWLDEDAETLRGLADLIAVSLSNARLSQEMAEWRREVETLRARYVREAWEQFVPTRPQVTYEYWESGADVPAGQAFPELGVLRAGTATTGSLDRVASPTLVSPIRLGDTVLGVIGLQSEEGAQAWTDEEREVLAAISEQMALVIENSRLFEEARLRAARERRAREITARMRETLDLDTILRTAVQEIGESLGIAEVEVWMQGETEEASS